MAATRSPATRRHRRGSLCPEEILAVGLQLLESDGADNLTMLRVAEAMSRPVTSIYWHYRTKDELLQALTEHVTRLVFAELPPGDRTRPWTDNLYDHFVAYRRAMLDSPSFLRLFASRAHSLYASDAIGEILTVRLEAGLTIICAAGIPPPEALRIYTACSSYTRGYTTLELDFRSEAHAEAADAHARRRHLSLDHDQFPLAAQLPDIAGILNYDDAQFSYGLRGLIDGLAARAAPATEPATDP